MMRVEKDCPFFGVGGQQYFVMRPGVVRVNRSRFCGAGDIENCQRASAIGLERADHYDYAARKKIINEARVVVPVSLLAN